MQAIDKRLESIELKVRKLLNRIEHVTIENKELTEENINLKQELQEIKSKIYTEETVDNTANSTDEKEGLQHIRRELDQYIEEVEECIKML